MRPTPDEDEPSGGVRRVLMTADTVGGVWTYALELARALGPHGVQVVLATLGAPLTPAQWAEVRALPHLTVEQSTFQLEWMDEPWADVAAAGDWLLGLEARVRPDVVHLNGYCHGALPWTAPVLMVGHSCVLSWWEAVKGECAPARYARYHEEVARGLRAAGHVVAPSRAMLGALQRHYGPLRDTAVIYNARRPEDFPPAAQREPFVLAAGRLWDEAKNVAALEAVAPRLGWPVRVAGESQHPSGGQRPSRGVEPLGRLSAREVAGFMGRASVYALPARYEPFGLSPVEAALAGCALVLGDIPSLREVWGEAALFVPPDNEEALALALESLRLDETRRARLAARARLRATEFSPGRMATAYLSAYHGLARTRARPPRAAARASHPSELSPA